jgi:hypothetical protein
MLNRRIIGLFVPFALAAITFLPSCKEETGTLGLEVLPSDDLLSGTDAKSYVPAENFDPVKLRSDDADYAIIGSVDDPYGGQTKASFLTQVNIGEYTEKFNLSDDSKNYYPDSLVVNLAYVKNWWFGNRNAKHLVKVHRITSPISSTDDYHTDMNVEGLYNPEPVGERISSAWDALPDSVWEDDSYVHQWKIRLDDELAKEIFNFQGDTLTSWKTFMEAFAGLFISSELIDTDTKGSLVRFDLLASESNMKLYYSYDEIDEATNEIDTTKHLSYTFPINIECARVNRFDHDAGSAVEFNDSTAEQYIIQGMAGSLLEVNFNDIQLLDGSNLMETWKDKYSSKKDLHAISAASLYFKADTTKHFSDDSLFYAPVPKTLRLYTLDENGNLTQPVYYYNENDQSQWSPQFSEGIYNSETAEYRFSLAGESFKMMVKNSELRGPYYLAPTDPISYPWRVILMNSPSDEDLMMPYLRLKSVTMNDL